MNARSTYPVRIEGRLDPGLSRWLWLVKWLLAIPHYIVLFFLWLAFFVLTRRRLLRDPLHRPLSERASSTSTSACCAGRGGWRFYSYGALGTDRYPPFTLGEAPDYPATLDVAYPERLSRGLVLVKWWLLAIPHYLVVGIFTGGGGYASPGTRDWAGPGLRRGADRHCSSSSPAWRCSSRRAIRRASSTSSSGSTAGSPASPSTRGS